MKNLKIIAQHAKLAYDCFDISINGVQVHVDFMDNIIAIAGTNQISDWKLNLNSEFQLYDDVYCHAGFLSGYLSIESTLHDMCSDTDKDDETKWIVTGHSMGGGISQIITQFSRLKIDKCVVFASPRVFLKNQKDITSGKILRIVNKWDLVNYLPPRLIQYKHCGSVKYVRSGFYHSMDEYSARLV